MTSKPHTLATLPLQQEPLIPWNRMLGGSQSRSGRSEERKISCFGQNQTLDCPTCSKKVTIPTMLFWFLWQVLYEKLMSVNCMHTLKAKKPRDLQQCCCLRNVDDNLFHHHGKIDVLVLIIQTPIIKSDLVQGDLAWTAWNLENGTDRLSQNFGKYLLISAV